MNIIYRWQDHFNIKKIKVIHLQSLVLSLANTVDNRQYQFGVYYIHSFCQHVQYYNK